MAATGLHYRHFTNKEQLAIEAFQFALAQSTKVRTENLDEIAAAAEKLRRAIGCSSRRHPRLDATVLANLLFNIEANPIVHGPGKWVSRDLGRRRLTTKERLILLPIVAHVAWFTKSSSRVAPFSFVSVRRLLRGFSSTFCPFAYRNWYCRSTPLATMGIAAMPERAVNAWSTYSMTAPSV